MHHDAAAAQAEQEREKWDRLKNLAGDPARKLACAVEAARWEATYTTERRAAERLVGVVRDLERRQRHGRA